MTEISFSPALAAVGAFEAAASIEEIASEPRLVGLSFDQALEQAGPLGTRILDAMCFPACPEGLFPIVDSRAHRLMPGMYPAIPGWHCDDWPRPDYHSQPDPALWDRRAAHYLGIIETVPHVSLTQFVTSPLKVSFDPTEPLWKQVHKAVDASAVETSTQVAGQVLRMSGNTIHRASPCFNRGWRYWMRLSFMHHAPEKALTVGPEQTYVLSEANGW